MSRGSDKVGPDPSIGRDRSEGVGSVDKQVLGSTRFESACHWARRDSGEDGASTGFGASGLGTSIGWLRTGRIVKFWQVPCKPFARRDAPAVPNNQNAWTKPRSSESNNILFLVQGLKL